MKIMHVNSFYKINPSFQSNARKYKDDNSNDYMHTLTYLFREDIDWKQFTDYMVKHFGNNDKVQFLQFASSDGSEAYTQIITLLENYPKQVVDKFSPIFAYDIDEEVVDASRSGLLNLTEEDKKRFSLYTQGTFADYFTPTKKELDFSNDGFLRMPNLDLPNKISDFDKTLLFKYRTYSVSEDLKSRVHFNKADMFDVLRQHKDSNNTIILCKNVLGHFSQKQVDYFLNILQRVLEKGSLFVIGELDAITTLARKCLETKGFREVLHNVYQRV